MSRLAVVTGASGGIGAECARRLAADGWDLVLHGSAPGERLDRAVQAVRDRGRQAIPWTCDLATDDPAASLAAALPDDAQPVGLVHAAGIAPNGLAVRVDDDTIDRALAVNLSAGIKLAGMLARPMMQARYGRVVMIGSTAALAGNPGQSIYGASKQGLIGFVRSFARELASRNITANVVAPGWIETAMTSDILTKKQDLIQAEIPIGRVGTAAEVAGPVSFLMSDDAAYITGQTLCVNGGLWMV